jgi:hypothetical protein
LLVWNLAIITMASTTFLFTSESVNEGEFMRIWIRSICLKGE